MCRVEGTKAERIRLKSVSVSGKRHAGKAAPAGESGNLHVNERLPREGAHLGCQRIAVDGSNAEDRDSGREPRVGQLLRKQLHGLQDQLQGIGPII